MILALDGVNQYFLSVAALFLILLLGGWFLLRLHAFYLRHPLKTLASLPFETGGGEMWRSLGGAVGVGNIFGVAAALAYGGAGALFWMWVGAFFSMGIKYAEITLGMLPHRGGWGGAVGYIRDAFGRGTAVAFALLLVGESLLMGGMLQSRAIAETASLALKTPPSVCGLVLCALLGLALWKAGSGKGLSRILVPLACGGYLLLCLCVILRHADRLPRVFVQIFSDAFTPRAPLGILGTPAMRQGIAKGVFSNEAGCGTAPTAHQSAKETTPAVQGLFGIFEVFVDTLLLCTATGLSILLTNGGRLSAYRGAEARLCVDTFADLLPRAAGAAVFGFVFLFAFETLLAFFAYSRQTLTAFSLSRALRAAVSVAFFCAVCFGAQGSAHALWTLSDLLLLCMLLCNTTALFCGRHRVKDAFEGQIGKDFSSLSKGRKRLCVQDRRAGRVICGSRSRSGYRRWTP